ncbi:hypothetical protein LCGC14_0720370 [marine sediment metagenome]|uniref:KTSC domain-containing protein n=1 Tax=marine sediment metagenome TaxID=412755 RepID=A0A0F9QGR1_9ZZZZ
MARRIKPYLRGGKGRFVSSTVIVPITRKEQQYLHKEVRVGRLENRSYPIKPVSSSNLAEMGYLKTAPEAGRVYVGFLSGKSAVYYDVPFIVFEEFYYAHSKGTFFYRFIRQGGYRWNYV